MSVLGGMNPLPKPDGPSPITPLAPPPSVLTPTNAPFRMPKPDVTLRSFSDPIATRKNIYDSVLNAARSAPPVSNKQFTLQLSDVDYDGPDDYTIADQKAAILEGRTLGRKLRGTWSLIDNVTGQLVDKKTSTLARVPHLTQRGTFIHNGNEYAINSQLRLRPGIYTRLKENGEVEAHANIMPGKGASHRYYLDPAKGQFYAKISQAKIPVLPVLRALGAKDSDIKEAWGHELFSANVKDDDTQAINKLYEKLVKARDPLDDGPTRTRKVVEAFRGMELDPEVMSRTLKSPYSHIDADSLLATTKKLIAVSRGEDEVDDRDHLANQTVHGPEDFFAERISKDAGRIRGLLLWKAGLRRNLSHVQPGALTHQIESALLNSGLANAAEEINLSEILDKQTRITRLGEGGISDISAIPREARAVQPSHLGFIDPSRTSESLRIGIDVYMANAARKGSDGLVYSPFKDVRTGETIYKSPQEIAKSAITFPGELAKPAKRVIAMRNGKMQYMRREDIDYEMPSMEEGFSALSNLIPGKSGMKAQRVAMGSRMLTQALPLEGAEAPLVQNALPNDHSRSYEDELGMALGAVRADKPGRVIDVTDTNIKVKYDDGTETDHQIYKTFPFNRKSEITQTPAVTVGQVFKPGDLLAYSNHTDKNGTTALGKNFRTGYYAHKGFNFEDAIVISESAAKRLTSQHLYQHGIDWTDAHKPGKKAYIGLFPKKFNKAQYDTLDDDGVVKPGTVVNYGDPIIVAAKKRELSQNKIHKRHEAAFGDATETWQHHDPGIVADVAKTPRGFNVSVKSLSEMKVGDKMSGLMGDKSIVAAIVPDHLMPHDEEGKPIEVAQNPMGVISRGNPTQMAVGILGKIAAKTGVPYKLPDFNSERSLVQFAIDEAAKHGVKDLEDIIDPETGRKIPNVYVGNRFFMKLHHSAESKGQGRGLGGYTSSGEPAKGGQTGSKKISGMDVHALLSHGAYAVLRDAGAIRGQRSEEYWVPFMRGLTPPKPKVPMIYEKFINDMRASGIHVIPENGYTHILPMTDREIDEMAGDRRIKSGETVHLDKGMAPVVGGLFDPTLTGSHDGTRWAAIDLHEPMPNPLMEDPIRRVLGLTEKQFLGVLSGREKLPDGGTGPAGIKKALEKINLPRELAMTRAALQSGRKTARDQAVRKLGYLKSAQWMGIHPKDWMLTKVPVMPPRFRPISMLGDSGMPLVSDPNYNYKELIDANDNLRELAKDVEDVGDERLSLYNSFKTVVGLSDPTHPKLREKNVKGILAHLFGNSPKTSMLQQRLISSTVDLVGRGVVVPDPALDMDQIGLPEEKAWEIYKNFIIRRLHRRGMPVTTAAKHVVDRSPLARDTMLEEMDSRPVIVNRAPVLHRFGIMAFKPKLYKGDAVRTSPLIVGGFGMDYDGDTMQYHVPVDDVAAREALDRMLPSKNLISPADMVTPVHGPKNEYTGGLYTATTKSQKPRKHVFRNKRDAINAWLAGSVDAQDEVDILEDK